MTRHNWEFLDNIVFTDYICRNCKVYGRERNGEIRVWDSLLSLSCKEIREKFESHQFDKWGICNKCGLKMNSYNKRLYWSDKTLDCDEVIILEDHQFDKWGICSKCELKMDRIDNLYYYWHGEILDCDEVIIKGIIE
jgi:hypothetical protein